MTILYCLTQNPSIFIFYDFMILKPEILHDLKYFIANKSSLSLWEWS